MSQQIDDGGPAFPLSSQPLDAQGNPIACNHTEWGMRLRDWFAGQALAGLVHRYDHPQLRRDVLAQDCYDIADAMLAARLTKPE